MTRARSRGLSAGAIVLLAGAIVLCAAPDARAHRIETGDDCRCDAIRATAGWCGHCETGYLAGAKVASRELIEAVDPHGHPVDVATLECAGCRAAGADHGLCPTCGWGVLDGRIYASRLTYYLALGSAPRGEAAVVAAGEVVAAGDACGARHVGDGWCEACGTGRVRGLAYATQSDLDGAGRELARLDAALELLPGCETCAIACVFGATCPECGIAYPR